MTNLTLPQSLRLCQEVATFDPNIRAATGPEPAVLPLDDPPLTDGVMCMTPVVQSKSGRFPGLLNTTTSGFALRGKEFAVQPPEPAPNRQSGAGFSRLPRR